MADAGRGRGRGFALLDNLKKLQSEKSEGSQSSEVPAPTTSSDSAATPSSGRGRMAALLSKMQSKPGVEEASTSAQTSLPASEASRLKGLQLLDQLKRKPVAAAVAAAPTQSEITSLSKSMLETSIGGRSDVKPKNKYFREVKDTPPVVRMGTTGTPVEVTANYIRLNFRENSVFEYEVRYEPDQDYKHLRCKLLYEHRDLFKVHTFDGTTLYLPSQLPDEVTSLTSTNPFDNSTVQVKIIFRRTRRLSEMIHIYNVLFKQIMKDLELVRFNREHFSAKDAKIIPQHKLQVWPGYVTAVDEYEGGLMLTLDSTSRVLRSEPVLGFMKDIIGKDKNFKNTLTEALVGCSVMTTYNKKLYRVDSIDYEANPTSTFTKMVQGELVEMSYVDYYKSSYNIHIMDLKQPLLISRQTKRVAGQEEPADFLFCLVPELCQLTGLSSTQRNDFQLMKDVATYTRITPNQRHLAFKQYIKNVLDNEKARNRLLGWGLSIAPETIDICARKLPPETIYFGNNIKIPGQEKADWNMDVTRNPVINAKDIRDWVILYVKKNERAVQDFVDTILRCGRPMGIMVSKPSMVLLQSENTSAYIQALSDVSPPTQLVVVICPNARDDRYAAIKKICCSDRPIPSQVINARTIQNQSKIRSVTQKIALQINCKLGGTLWSINIPFKHTMIVGIDSYHDPSRRNRSVCGFIASYNQSFTQWYSRAVFQDKGQEIVDCLRSCLVDALNFYMKINSNLPDRIIIYRDGVGDGQLKVLRDYEIPQLKIGFPMVQHMYSPALTYIVVQKRINTRIFLKLNGGLENPSPGTIVDHDVTRRDWFDFLIVSQKVRQGTVTPSHYIVVHDDSNTDADKWQRLTYKLCHLYYNWPGTVRVPAPCQYAHKLAYLVGQHTKKTTAEILADKLFFL